MEKQRNESFFVPLSSYFILRLGNFGRVLSRKHTLTPKRKQICRHTGSSRYDVNEVLLASVRCGGIEICCRLITRYAHVPTMAGAWGRGTPCISRLGPCLFWGAFRRLFIVVGPAVLALNITVDVLCCTVCLYFREDCS